MQPEQIVGVAGLAWAHGEPACAIGLDDVFDDRAGLAERELAIGDDRRRAEGCERPVLCRRQPGLRIALIVLQLKPDAELLAKPDDPVGLRNAEMVHDDHERQPPAVESEV
jgi:hypothetical protein